MLDDRPSFIRRLADLPSNAIIIEGIVGQGKSVFLRSLAVEEIRSNEAKRLPILIELKDLNAKSDLRQALFKQFESYDVDVEDDTLNYLFRSGRLALLLDGFDELEESLVKSTYLEIEYLVLRYPELLVVVTSRPGREIQKSSAFRLLQIAKLTSSEFGAFLGKLGVDATKSLALRQAIKNSPSKISSLISTPLMLTLVVIVYQAEAQIPETLPEFFNRLFQVVFSRHDHLKAAFNRKHHSGLSERALQELFEAFCFMNLQLGYGRTLTLAQFNEVFDLAQDYSENGRCEAEKFQQDITQVACLMLEDGIDSITFLHKSILEYFAAAFVRRLSDENAQLFYDSVMSESGSWVEVLTFLKAIDPFRHAQYYVLPVVERERSEILARVEGSSDRDLIELLANIYPDLGAYFRLKPDDDTKVVIGAYGSFYERSGEHLGGGLGFLIMDALGETVPTPLELDEVRTTFGVDPSISGKSQHGVHVLGGRLLHVYGTKAVRSAFGMYETRLRSLETDSSRLAHRLASLFRSIP